eukprot:114193_1
MGSITDSFVLLVQLIIFIASGFTSASLLDLIPMKDQLKGGVITIVCAVSALMVSVKIIRTESRALCCKYFSAGFIPCFICAPLSICRHDEIPAVKNVRSFWISWVDIAFDLIQAQLLMACVDPDDIGSMKWLIPV